MMKLAADTSLGDLLRIWRKRRGRSQLEVSFDVGVSQRHISFVESGRSAPSRSLLLTIASILNVPFRDRNDLLLAAGFAPIYSEPAWDADEMRAEAELSSQVTFGNKTADYNYSGNTVVLTAETVHNYAFNLTSAALRMELWALPAPYSGGAATGFKLAQFSLAPLMPGAEYANVNSGTIAFTPPPSGKWYFVMMLSEFSGGSSNGGYTINNWFNFATPVVFGSPLSTALAVEYYYPAWNFYFVTAFSDEIDALDRGAFGGVWRRTGQRFQVWPEANATSTPTCRFFSIAFAPMSSHFYTPFPSECQHVETDPADVAAWQFENIAFHIQLANANGVCTSGTIPLFRLYNNGVGGAPNHRYTINPIVFDQMIAQGWAFEGNGDTKVFACVPG